MLPWWDKLLYPGNSEMEKEINSLIKEIQSQAQKTDEKRTAFNNSVVAEKKMREGNNSLCIQAVALTLNKDGVERLIEEFDKALQEAHKEQKDFQNTREAIFSPVTSIENLKVAENLTILSSMAAKPLYNLGRNVMSNVMSRVLQAVRGEAVLGEAAGVELAGVQAEVFGFVDEMAEAFGTAAEAAAEAGVEAGAEAGVEAGVEAGAQAGAGAAAEVGAEAGVEAGAEAGVEAGAEAGVEAGVEAGAQAAAEAAAEVGAEAGVEAGVEAGAQAGAGAGGLGVAGTVGVAALAFLAIDAAFAAKKGHEKQGELTKNLEKVKEIKDKQSKSWDDMSSAHQKVKDWQTSEIDQFQKLYEKLKKIHNPQVDLPADPLDHEGTTANAIASAASQYSNLNAVRQKWDHYVERALDHQENPTREEFLHFQEMSGESDVKNIEKYLGVLFELGLAKE